MHSGNGNLIIPSTELGLWKITTSRAVVEIVNRYRFVCRSNGIKKSIRVILKGLCYRQQLSKRHAQLSKKAEGHRGYTIGPWGLLHLLPAAR